MFVLDGGGGNLQDTYNEGAPAVVQVITLGTAGRLGIAVRDAAAPIVGNLFEITNNTDTVEYFGVTATLVSTNVQVAWQYSDATNSGIVDEVTIQRNSSVAAIVGFGVGTLSKLKDDTSLVNASRISTVWNNVATATSDADITFQLRTVGAALAERYRFSSNTMSVTPATSPWTLQNIATASTIVIKGNGSAGGGADNCSIDTGTALTAGTILRTKRNGGNVGIDVSWWGGLQVASGTLSRTGAQAYNIKSVWNASAITDNNEAIVMDLVSNGADLQLGITATLATQRLWRIGAPNVKVGVTARTITDCIGFQWDSYNVATSVGALTVTNFYMHRMATSTTLGTSGTTTTYSMLAMSAHTITYINTTGSTAACGVAGLRLDQITVAQNTGAGTLTVTNGATLYIVGHPLDGTGSTITNKYALFVDSGVSRFDGDGTNVFEIDADTTAPGAATGRIPFKDTSSGATRFIMVSDT